MRKHIVVAGLVAVSGAVLAQHTVLQEDFEGYGGISGIGSLPAPGAKANVASSIATNMGTWVAIPGLPNNARYSAPNAFADDFVLANGIDNGSKALAGLNGTTSMGLKNEGKVAFKLGTGAGLGTVDVSMDVATSESGGVNEGQRIEVGLVAGDPDGTTLTNLPVWGASLSTNVALSGIDVSSYGTTGIYVVVEKFNYGNSAHIDNIIATASIAPVADITAPAPNPAVIASAVHQGFNAVKVTAQTAADESDVLYYFTCTAGGGNDSGWQFSPEYIDTELTENTAYTYTVVVKDTSVAENMTSTSSPVVVSTASPNLVLSEDFEGYDSIAGIASLPSPGTKMALATEIAVNDGGWKPIIGLPNNARFSAPNSFGDDFWLANGVDHTGNPISGLTNTVSFGLKNEGMLTFHLGVGASLGVINASLDVASANSGGQNLHVRILEGFNGSGSVLASTAYNGVNTNMTVSLSGIDVSSYALENIYLQIDRDGYGNSIQVDNIAVYASSAPVIDTLAPMPNPAGIASAAALDPYSIELVATNAYDDNDVVYYFTAVSGGGNDSGWQFSPTYVDTGLTGGQEYTYTVMVKDLSAAENVTAASASVSVTTPDPDVEAPSPDPMTFVSAAPASDSSVELVAFTATDDNAVEYYFTAVSGGGNDSGWQSSTVYVDTGLAADTEYGYTVKARDLSLNTNETASSSTILVTTRRLSAGTEVLSEDFETSPDWATLAGGSLPAAETAVLVGTSAESRTNILFNGWNFLNDGAGPFGDDVAVVHGAGNDGRFNFANAGGSVSLGLKNWTMVYKEVDLSALGGKTTVTLSFDYFTSDQAMNEANSLYYGIFDVAPTPGNRNDWSATADDMTLGALASQQKGSVSANVDVSAFSGSLYIGFFKRNWTEGVGIDNVSLSIPEDNYYTWIDGYGNLSVAERTEDADPDMDGRNNFYEFAFGGNATNEADTGIDPQVWVSGGNADYAYVVTSDSLTYTPKMTQNLAFPSWDPVAGATGSGVMTNGFEWYTVPGTNDVEFYKLDVNW